jgi:hypothetical protein
MEPNEEYILQALAWMTLQYIGSPENDHIDTMCMSAGERAVEVLAKYGLVEISGGNLRSAQWTEAGKQFLATH